MEHAAKLQYVIVDSGKNIYGTEKGWGGQIYNVCESVRWLKPMVIHCISHQQILCGKYLNLSCISE